VGTEYLSSYPYPWVSPWDPTADHGDQLPTVKPIDDRKGPFAHDITHDGQRTSSVIS